MLCNIINFSQTKNNFFYNPLPISIFVTANDHIKSEGTSPSPSLHSPSSKHSQLPASIVKCPHCDHFAESRAHLADHMVVLHPGLQLQLPTTPNPNNHTSNNTNNTSTSPGCSAAAYDFMMLSGNPAALAAYRLAAAQQQQQQHNMSRNNHAQQDDDMDGNELDENEKRRRHEDHDQQQTIHMNNSINHNNDNLVGDEDEEGDENDDDDVVATDDDDQNTNVEEEIRVGCPLCQDQFSVKRALEQHLMTVHSVSSDGLARLLNIVDPAQWLPINKSTKPAQSPTSQIPQREPTDESEDAGKNAVISEKHVYKYRCKLCSLAFKTPEKLNTHALYHSMRDATRCHVCGRNFRSAGSLQKHVELVHGDAEPGADDTIKMEELQQHLPMEVGEIAGEEDNSTASSKIVQNRTGAKTNMSPTGVNTGSYPTEKYLDPNRPFKCDICRESFTQKNILLVHYNSVSHLHKLKKHTENNNTPPSTSPNHQIPSSVASSTFDLDALPTADESTERKQTGTPSSTSQLSEANVDYDSPKKRFRCDICKVAYAQGSTLDIHMRSVLHQSRACRLQENQNNQHQAVSLVVSSPSQINAQSQAQQFQQQQLVHCVSPTPSNQSIDQHTASPKLNNQIYKTLLENFGFDIVKQFNEINKAHPMDLNMSQLTQQLVQHQQLQHQQLQQQQLQQNQSLQAQHQPQLHKSPSPPATKSSDQQYFCRHCKQMFSSIFVLKSHCEEQHNEQIPVEFLEQFAEKFKHYYIDGEQTPLSGGSNAAEVLDFSAKKETASKLSKENHNKISVVPSHLMQLQLPPPSPNDNKLQQLQQQQQLDPAAQLAHQMLEQNFAGAGFGAAAAAAAAAAAGGVNNMPTSMNTLEMLNLMQFHHLMSLNFMNLAPPLIFGGGSGGTSTAGGGGINNPTHGSTASAQSNQASDIMQQHSAAAAAAAQAASNNQKRARTRITDEQLKILRAHFDINNSPSEDSIKDMSLKANLPPKVVKHWFRNTLFKERQRNKDSPYNFNNPPSTTLNLEEYERTGQTKVTALVAGAGDVDASALGSASKEREQREQQQVAAQQMMQVNIG